MAAPYSGTIRAVPWTIGQALLVFLVPWLVLPSVFDLLVHYLAASSVTLAHFARDLDAGKPGPTFSFVMIEAIGSFWLIGYYLRRYGLRLPALGLRPFSLGRMLLYLGVLVLTFGFLVTAADLLVQLFYPGYNPSQPQTNEFTQAHSSLSLWALVIIPPFVEETTFRGFMFPAFAKRWGVIGGALASSLLFAFAHLQLNVSVYTFVLGLLLCFLYTRLGSIVPGIAVHMINNYVAYMALNQK